MGVLPHFYLCYCIGHGDVKMYVPVLSVYGVFAGAYIMHEPDGDDIKQLVAVPAGVCPDGHDVFAIVM